MPREPAAGPVMLARVERKKLWKLKAPKPGVLYSTYRESPTCVLVLENGSREIHRRTLPPDDSARYVIQDGWLVEETYPAGMERLRRETTKRRKAAAEHGAAARAPAFQTLLREMTSALGEPEKRDREKLSGEATVWHFRAPRSSKQRAHWIARARECGGAATVWTLFHGGELCVVAGKVSRLATLFTWVHWKTAAALRVLDAIDRDAGLRITCIEDHAFELELDRAPSRPEVHAAKLSTVFRVGTARALASALRNRRCRCERRM